MLILVVRALMAVDQLNFPGRLLRVEVLRVSGLAMLMMRRRILDGIDLVRVPLLQEQRFAVWLSFG